MPEGEGTLLQAAHIPVPVRRFSYIHVDFVGPLVGLQVFEYLFTVVDRTTTRRPEAIPLAAFIFIILLYSVRTSC
jgi:hypothetical protein